jgi:3'(2'), 5'-bisphosphate nucleotidase
MFATITDVFQVINPDFAFLHHHMSSNSGNFYRRLVFIGIFLLITMTTLVAKKLTSLCTTCKAACDIMAPMVGTFYTAINGETSKLKADASVFTIADGIVQHMLINHLFAGGKFKEIVGEEDCPVNLQTKPYTVADLTVPEDFNETIENTLAAITSLAAQISPDQYQDLSIFIDPIDGTREFSTAMGEQCSICIGFSSSEGKPVAGLVYRPLTTPATWAAGAASESYTDSLLDMAKVPCPKGLLTSNGAISDFIGRLIEETGFERVKSGGAGNKMLMLLEKKGGAYIQDRGVSRWDTCGAQAVIEAHGGLLSKLTSFVDRQELQSYTYLKSAINLDFEPGAANLTPYNAADRAAVKKGVTVAATEVSSVLPYSNLCGLLALDQAAVSSLDSFHAAMKKVKEVAPPSYD